MPAGLLLVGVPGCRRDAGAPSGELPARELQDEPREERRPHGQTIDADVLVQGVRAASLDAQPCPKAAFFGNLGFRVHNKA